MAWMGCWRLPRSVELVSKVGRPHRGDRKAAKAGRKAAKRR